MPRGTLRCVLCVCIHVCVGVYDRVELKALMNHFIRDQLQPVIFSERISSPKHLILVREKATVRYIVISRVYVCTYNVDF